MMSSEVIMEMAGKMEDSLEAFKSELTRIRTGRASLSLLDGIKVETYGSSIPLNQVGSLTIPESRQIVIQPWDPQVMSSIEKAILKSGLGLTPINDGKVIRINIPQLTEERRKELVKVVKRLCEDAKVTLRNIRRNANEEVKKLEKSHDIGEDEMHSNQDEIQKLTDGYVKQVEEVLSAKEKEVLEI